MTNQALLVRIRKQIQMMGVAGLSDLLPRPRSFELRSERGHGAGESGFA